VVLEAKTSSMTSNKEEVAGTSDGTIAFPFETLHEFQAPSQAETLRLCPTMDLLLLLTAKGSVHIYRIGSGQRIAHIGNPSGGNTEGRQALPRVTSACWKHDGKHIALAYSNGRVRIHDVSRVVGVHKSPSSSSSDSDNRVGPEVPIAGVHRTAVSCLTWATAGRQKRKEEEEEDEEEEEEEDRAVEIFRRLPMPFSNSSSSTSSSSPYATGDGGRKEEEQREWRPRYDEKGLDFLVSADEAGAVHVRAFGLLTLVELDLRKRAREAAVGRIAEVGLTCDSSQLVVLYNGDRNIPRILLFDTTVLRNHRKELRRISKHVCEIDYLLSHIAICVDSMKLRWATAHRALVRKFSQIEDACKETGHENARMDVELLHLLVTGIPSSGLRAFLTDYLPIARLEDARRAIDSACYTILEAVQTNLLPALEQAIFRLVDLRGIVKWMSEYSKIVLDIQPLEEVISRTERALLVIEALRGTVIGTQKGFKYLFKWLLNSIKKFSSDSDDHKDISQFGEEEEKFSEIAKCLRDDFMRDKIGSFFIAKKTKPSEEEEEEKGKSTQVSVDGSPVRDGQGAKEKGRKAAPSSSSSSSLPVDTTTFSATEAMGSIRDCWAKVLREPSASISKLVRLNSIIKVENGSVGKQEKKKVVSKEKEDNNGARLAAVKTNHPSGRVFAAFGLDSKSGLPELALMRLPGRNPGEKVETALLSFEEGAGMQVEWVEFYNDKNVAMVLSKGKRTSFLWLVDYTTVEFSNASKGTPASSSSPRARVHEISLPGVNAVEAKADRAGAMKKAILECNFCEGRSTAALLDSKLKLVALDLGEVSEDEDEDEDEDEGEQENQADDDEDA